MKVQKQISLKDFTTAEGFVGRYQHLIKDVVIPYQYKVLCDEMEGVEKSHVIRNFINAGKALRGEDVGDGFYGMVFPGQRRGQMAGGCGLCADSFPGYGVGGYGGPGYRYHRPEPRTRTAI